MNIDFELMVPGAGDGVALEGTLVFQTVNRVNRPTALYQLC